jgi:hypothetical protein
MMQCPACQSQNVLLCSVAHEQGTVTTTTKGTASGTGSGYTMGASNAFSSAMNTSVNTTSTSRTAFAERCAPPTSTVGWAILATLVAAVIYIGIQAYLHADVRPVPAGTGTHVMLGILAACVLWLVLAIRNRPRYRESLERWRRTWVCASCGHFFLAKE